MSFILGLVSLHVLIACTARLCPHVYAGVLQFHAPFCDVSVILYSPFYSIYRGATFSVPFTLSAWLLEYCLELRRFCGRSECDRVALTVEFPNVSDRSWLKLPLRSKRGVLREMLTIRGGRLQRELRNSTKVNSFGIVRNLCAPVYQLSLDSLQTHFASFHISTCNIDSTRLAVRPVIVYIL